MLNVRGAVPLLVGGALAANLYFTLFPSSTRLGLLADLRFIVENPRLSYHDKMERKYPEVYRNLRFIIEHTDTHVTVLVPASLYQGAVTSYLLFPRTVDTHREGFLWGRVPAGTIALLKGRWPDGVSDEVRRVSRLVAAAEDVMIIERIQ